MSSMDSAKKSPAPETPAGEQSAETPAAVYHAFEGTLTEGKNVEAIENYVASNGGKYVLNRDFVEKIKNAPKHRYSVPMVGDWHFEKAKANLDSQGRPIEVFGVYKVDRAMQLVDIYIREYPTTFAMDDDLDLSDMLTTADGKPLEIHVYHKVHYKSLRDKAIRIGDEKPTKIVFYNLDKFKSTHNVYAFERALAPVPYL